jgi:hypothetical protein
VQVRFFRSHNWRLVEIYAFDLFVFSHTLWLNVIGNPLGIMAQTPVGILLLVLQLAIVVGAVRGFYQTTLVRALPLGLLLFTVYAAGLVVAGFATFAVLALAHG